MTDWIALFEEMHPGFFEKEVIRGLPPGRVFEEMALALPEADPPWSEGGDGIHFGFYDGSLEALRDIVRRVDEGWVPLYNDKSEVYCAFCGETPVSFCMIEDMGVHGGLRIGGPGCVGTVPEARRRGIGLKMIGNATRILRERGYDVSYIHFTGVAGWYAKLGYRTVLRWTREGLLVD